MSQPNLEDLNHVTKPLPDGGMVLVLDTGATIDQEAEAMIQALHSRSTGGIAHHLEVLAERGPKNFMKNFYVGYGHKSIGDLGTATVFVEGVSMLAAKALQDWALYSGQEASTRYVDFSKQPFIDPLAKKETRDILEAWRAFYLKAQKATIKDLRKRFPKQPDEDENQYEKAIAARAFDITRGLLPAGASTNLAIHANLRQLADRIQILRHHPLEEVRNISEVLQEALQEQFPSSFGHKRYEKTEEYNKSWKGTSYYFTQDTPVDFKLTHNWIDTDLLSEHKDILQSRPPKTELPKLIAECGTVQFEFQLDFGSFRDIQRHRAVAQRMPLLTMDHGFADWYMSELPAKTQKEAKKLLAEQKDIIENLQTSPEIAQYYIPMGYELPNRVTGDLPALVYLVELRATRFVHPTLRRRAIQMAHALEAEFGDLGLVIHLDPDPDRFDIRRGAHDIQIKD